MRFSGLVKTSFCDYPGRVSAVVFTQGCNFRCPYCHNPSTLRCEPCTATGVDSDAVLEHLRSRAGRLEGLVVSGGEPTLQPKLPVFLRQVRSLGYAVKLDTNGSRPDVLEELFAQGLVDFVAMDIKAPLWKYRAAAGTRVSTEAVATSIALIAGSGLEHEFRTTVVASLLSEADVQDIARTVPRTSCLVLQPFVPKKTFDPAYADENRVIQRSLLAEWAQSARRGDATCSVR